jgi:hypothetical protein
VTDSNTVNRRRPVHGRSQRRGDERFEARFAGSNPAKPAEAVKLEAKATPTIERAVELFLSDKRSQGLETAVLKKYEQE